ncbi:MAG: hypothetical protein HY049_15530 [Acidobacteria bacterium]|nr:hypothetical protein [Acidobacteriota bacterium]
MSGERPAGDAREAGEPGAPTYQGSRFPWWLALIWLAFLAWGGIYIAMYYLPDLKAWLR